MIISMISAVAENRAIGIKGHMPWHMPADFTWFKEKTKGKTILMGLNTFKFGEIGGKPLPNRKHIILSNDPDFVAPENCVKASSIEESIALAGDVDEVMICGGASVYTQFLPKAKRLYLTEIHQTFEGDTFFPEVNREEWNEVFREDHKADEKNAYDYSFVILERK